jgi:hypothetical protein
LHAQLALVPTDAGPISGQLSNSLPAAHAATIDSSVQRIEACMVVNHYLYTMAQRKGV